jgi:ATP-binding cassette subfamily B protein
MPLLVYRALYFGRRFRPLSLQVQKQLAVLTTAVEQNLRGSRVVKAFSQEQAEIERFDGENVRWFHMSARAAQMQAVNVPLLFLIANIGMVVIIWYGGRQVIRGELTLGVLIAFTTYLGQLIEPVRRLGMIIPAVAIAGAASERIFEILDTIPEVKDEPGAQPLPILQGCVRFERVSFSYGQRQVLKEVDFEVEPGQVVALLGPTGSGKSTIISLIPRFYDPTFGCIRLDGYDIRKATLQSLRSQIGIVLQEATLFAATIRENIAFGCAGAASDEQIIAAAKAAQAHDFILKMPQGYDTKVGERGVTLSGGQKQRLAIARALLLDPRLLILDDATASVDTETEQLIQLALENLIRGRTTFVIAHRLSTVRRADLILVLEAGRIAARGTHSSLLSSSKLYAEIYRRQLKQQESLLQADEVRS